MARGVPTSSEKEAQIVARPLVERHASFPHRGVILTIVCLLGFGLSLIINYPGFMSYDSVEQILEARAGKYEDYHPPIMAFTWHFTDKAVPGPFGMLIFETFLIWAGTFLVAKNWFRNSRSTVIALAPCLLIFYPPVFGISGGIWKDIFMWSFLILGVGALGVVEPVAVKPKFSNLIMLGLGFFFLSMAMMYRHNAFFPIFPLVALGVVRAIGGLWNSRRVATVSLSLFFFMGF
jgi:hypothetical protein